MIELPEGTTQDLVVLTDDLEPPARSATCSRYSADFDITYEFIGIASINGHWPRRGRLRRPSRPTARAGHAVWSIGTVVTERRTTSSRNAAEPRDPDQLLRRASTTTS